MKRVAILGAGGMGTALALMFARRGLAVQLWARKAEDAAEMARVRFNERHLPGVCLPPEIGITSNACDASAAADLLVAAIPSAYLRATLLDLAERVPSGLPVLSVIKGIEVGTLARPSRIIAETLGPGPVAVLSGPSHAEEVAKGLPASVVVAGEDEKLNAAVRDALNGPAFRVYTNPDAVGVELAGALKNVLGIAAGICDGLGFGDNAKAALLTRGLVEMARFAVDQGARPTTFYGLAGVGDVVTTCYSPFGRNRAVGEALGRGRSLAEILAGMANVAEGVPTARSLHEWAARRGVAMPITDEVYRILFEGKSPLAAVTDLMDRDPKDEWQAMTTALPDSCTVAFKEWAGVCDALGSGRQSLILRKGGVSEGPGGFRPEHPAFWLYPTHVHEAEQKLRTPSSTPIVETPGAVAIDALAVVEWTGRVERLEQLKSIEGLHDWTDETVRHRFRYRSPGLWALAVRIYRRAEPWSLPVTPEHLGCKTWVPLETARPTSGLVPVLDDDESLGRLDRLRSAVEG